MAARRKKSPTEVSPTDQVPDAEVSTPPPAQAGPATSEEPGPALPVAEDGPRRQWQPDPFPLMAIALGPDKAGPRMTLFRSNRLNQMAIRFEDRPGDEHRHRLRDAGWRWRETEGVWTKQIDKERRAASQVEAERLFNEIGDAIRQGPGPGGRSGRGG